MSKPAKLPPPGTRPWELAIHTSSEILLGSLSFIAGLAVALGATLVGLIPAGQEMLVGPLTLVVTGLSYSAIEHLGARNESREVTPLLDEPNSVARSVLIALAGILAAQLGAALIALVQTELVGVEAVEQQTIVDLVERGDPSELAVLGISAVILAPLTEELLFRYMFFRRLVHGAGPMVAFGVSALAFSLFHFNPSGVVIYVWLGLVFATTYWLSGRLWVAMLTHAGYNAMAFSILVWGPAAAT